MAALNASARFAAISSLIDNAAGPLVVLAAVLFVDLLCELTEDVVFMAVLGTDRTFVTVGLL